MIEELPAEGIPRAAELVCGMMAEDSHNYRREAADEFLSIQSFALFLVAARHRLGTVPVAFLPPAQVTFYRATVTKMIGAGVLPDGAAGLFDKTFSEIDPTVTGKRTSHSLPAGEVAEARASPYASS
ncbi:MAG: hypothetical protein ABSE16_17340 [Verrucomicrobiota bacterium]